MWSGWCRLCAREPAAVPCSGAELEGRIAKYLALPLRIVAEDFTGQRLPDSVCEDCSETLNSFDAYAAQCEKVQSMYAALLRRREPFADAESCRSFRNDYMEKHWSSAGHRPNKFAPICAIKNEDDNPSNEIDNSLFKAIWIAKNSKLKNESDHHNQFEDNEGGSVNDDLDDEDHMPLSSISTKRLKQKRKSGRLKLTLKVKRKKRPKAVPDLGGISLDRELDIKTEPISDDDNIDKIDNNGEKKKRRQRQTIDDSIINFTCYICRLNCRNWHALCRHFTDVHNRRAEVQCCCGKYLASRISISRHSASHGKLDSFNCTKCDKKFPRLTELESHTITHLPKEEYPYVCCKCAKRFSTPQLLKHHEKKHIPMEERAVHTCKFCTAKFASKSNLAMHIRSVHERLKEFVCDQCGKAFATKGILAEHLARHSDIRAHICTVCDKSFKTKQRLAIHLDTHNNTIYQCPHCPMQLNSRRTLRMHLFVHDKILRYQCTECDKAFRRPKDLKNHSNIHSGRRPYACPWCLRTFANGSNCRAHKRRMHPNELRLLDEVRENKRAIKDSLPDEIDRAVPPPKVIHAIVKRKLNAEVKPPNFTYAPDISEKDFYDEKPPIKINLEMSEVNDRNRKLERPPSPPVHIYESSLSPLNLNASAHGKFNNGKSSMPAAFTITPLAQGFETITGYVTTNMVRDDCYASMPIAVLQNVVPKKDDAYEVCKKIPEQRANNAIVYSSLDEGNEQGVYPVTSFDAHSYEIQFDRN